MNRNIRGRSAAPGMPDIYTGKLGTARRASKSESPLHAAIMAMFLIEITDRSAGYFWRYHAVGVISLRELAGVPSAPKVYPEAEYQLVAFSIDPDRLSPTTENLTLWTALKPSNVELQFHGVSEAGAAEIARLVAFACCDGSVPIEPNRTADADKIWRGAVKSALEILAKMEKGEGLRAV
jgi:hypothetical protein